jgi:ABC-type Mn2+/Zn2+ transport system permease subunit
MMAAAVGFCALFSFLGIGTAFLLNWPPGATIALLAAVSYLSLLPLKKKKNFFNKTHDSSLWKLKKAQE